MNIEHLSAEQVPLIPIDFVLNLSNQGATYRHLVGVALKNDSPPDIVDLSDLPFARVVLSDAVRGKIQSIADRYRISFDHAFAGLCAAGARTKQKLLDAETTNLNNAISLTSLPFPPKSHVQRDFYLHIHAGLKENKITLAEASTGIGKGRALCAAAIEMAREKKTPVYIIAPTVAILDNLFNEFELLNHEGLKSAMLPGSHEFVNDLLLRQYIEESEIDPTLELDDDVKQWVQNGAPSLNPKRPLAKILKENASWLMEDLIALSNKTPTAGMSLAGGLFNEEWKQKSVPSNIIKNIRDFAKNEADIIFCTHRMLAIAQKTRWNVAPPPKVIIIDEANLFEQAVSDSNSDLISFFNLRICISRSLGMKQGSLAHKAVKRAKEISSILKTVDEKNNRSQEVHPDFLPAESFSSLTEKLKSLSEILQSRVFNDIRGLSIEGYRMAIKSVIRCLTQPQSSATKAYVSFSSERRYPSLVCGPSSLANQLRDIWRCAEGGVVLASATLYTMDQNGNYKGDYVRNLLHLDHARTYSPTPFIDETIFKLPTVFVPEDPSLISDLSPPSEETDESLKHWHQKLADCISHISDQACGGTLVLFTSYREIAAVTSVLQSKTTLKKRIVSQSAGKKFKLFEAEYRNLYESGRKPIFLALGTAWVGIDLRGNETEPKKDLLLTDLVITRCPISLNKTNSMRLRIERSGLLPVIQECLIVFKQGLGRLIRRQDVQNRKIWILDGRLFSSQKWHGMENLKTSIRRYLKEYETVRFFKI